MDPGNQQHVDLVARKVDHFLEMLQRTAIHVQWQKHHAMMDISEMHQYMEKLAEVQSNVVAIRQKLQDASFDAMQLVALLQTANNDLSAIFKHCGTLWLEDLLMVNFGTKPNSYSEQEEQTLQWLKKYFHPISYSVVTGTGLPATHHSQKQRASSSSFSPSSSFHCQLLDPEIHKSFYARAHGVSIQLQNPGRPRKLIAVAGILDPVVPSLLACPAHELRIQQLKTQLPASLQASRAAFDMFLSALSLAEWLTMPEAADVYQKFAGLQSFVRTLKAKPIATVVKEFLAEDLYQKRTIIMHLLIFSQGYENEYMAYLLYDLLSSDVDGHVDTRDQITIFDSLPWCVKKCFKTAMKRTIQYTNDLTHFDMQKIPLEQQICLLKVNDAVKEKAMQKWKEVKSKSEDTGSKARQYLEGLLKIPFGVYRREPMLDQMQRIKQLYADLVPTKSVMVTSATIARYLSQQQLLHLHSQSTDDAAAAAPTFEPEGNWDRKQWILACVTINMLSTKHGLLTTVPLLPKPYACKKPQLVQHVTEFVRAIQADPSAVARMQKDLQQHASWIRLPPTAPSDDPLATQWKEIQQYMQQARAKLDRAVHGHEKAKKQLERIIAQWMNGEASGYCFGFEGPPGVGKTSLAKMGLSQCLLDEQGNPRPFAMIQMGGDSNGSTLHGHNYTYVGSTWGSIVQILMDKKCMNPIIFIDEVDKISKTEHGKEITGILTHLLDPAQNDCFQDKYFSGVDLDLSKALFVLSYNDVSAIDRILLDRVHRVQFEHLSMADKLSICEKHLLPEIYQKMGLQDVVLIPEETLTFIVEEYTCESGVRKLKELLFEIVGEINLQILQEPETLQRQDLPWVITTAMVRDVYLKDRHPVRIQAIPSQNTVGLINGLWANAMGQGGIIPIQARWRPNQQFLQLHLTGTQGDTMKESMQVALTLAWERVPEDIRKEALENHGKEGIHIHCPDASTPKDGPSAGAAITCVLYSLLTNRCIRREVAVTGEVCLTGKVTEIGGLDLKILGGAKAGAKTFLYPEANQRDLDRFLEKYQKMVDAQRLTFYAVETIDQVLEKMLLDA